MVRAYILAALAVAALVPAAAAETVTVSLGGQDVDIEYTSTELEVVSGQLTDTSLILEVVSSGNPSSLVITLDRSVIDTLERAGESSPYFVLGDDFEIDTFEESEATETSRTLRIPVDTGVSEIEIVGEFVGGPPQDATAPPAADVEPAEPAEAPEEAPEDVPEEVPAPPAEDVSPPPAPVAPAPEPAEPAPEPPVAPAPVEPGTGAMADDMMAGQGSGQMGQETQDAMGGGGDMMGDGGMTAQDSCGPGTVLAADGVTCVLPPSAPREAPSYRELVFGAAAGFVVSLAVVVVLYGIARAARP